MRKDIPDGQNEYGLLSEIDAGKLSPDEGHYAKLKRYAEAKTRALLVSEHIISNYPQKFKVGAKVHQCGTFLVFHHYYTIDQYRLGKSNLCRKHLFCGLCAILRAAKQLRAYLEKMEIVMTQNPDLVLISVTITVKNGDDLMERFHHLQGNYRKLVQRRRDILKASGRNKKDTIFKYFHGAVATYELTRGDDSPKHPDTGWHPHMHMLCLVSPGHDLEIMHRDIKREWEDLTGDSHQCHVQAINYDDEESRIKAFVEVFKYPLKYNEMRVADQVHAGFKLHKNRLIASFGLLYGVKEPIELEDVIEEDLSLLPYAELLYGFSPSFGYQLKEQKIYEPDGWSQPTDNRLKLTSLQLEHKKEPDKAEPDSRFSGQVRRFCEKEKNKGKNSLFENEYAN